MDVQQQQRSALTVAGALEYLKARFPITLENREGLRKLCAAVAASSQMAPAPSSWRRHAALPPCSASRYS